MDSDDQSEWPLGDRRGPPRCCVTLVPLSGVGLMRLANPNRKCVQLDRRRVVHLRRPASERERKCSSSGGCVWALVVVAVAAPAGQLSRPRTGHQFGGAAQAGGRAASFERNSIHTKQIMAAKPKIYIKETRRRKINPLLLALQFECRPTSGGHLFWASGRLTGLCWPYLQLLFGLQATPAADPNETNADDNNGNENNLFKSRATSPKSVGRTQRAELSFKVYFRRRTLAVGG